VVDLRNNKTLCLVTVTLLLTTIFALYYLQDEVPADLRMTVFGGKIKEVDYDESVSYTINVRNVGEESKHVHLQVGSVPEHWDAALDKEDLTLPGRSSDVVILTVTAPPKGLARSRSLAQVAEVGVRAGNVTIGTITILKGTATLTRDGKDSSLKSGDEILSGDIISTTGESVIAIDPKKLINNSKTYTGNIYVLLSDATVGFLRYQDTAYMTFISGEVTIWVPGGGGGGRAPSAIPVINLSENELVDTELPDHEYNAIMEFGSLEEHAFFHVNITEEETTVEVFDGKLVIGNDVANQSLNKFEQTTTTRSTPIPAAWPVERTIISLETNDSVERVVESQGTNVLELDNVYYAPMGDREYYITPLLPEITIDLLGKSEGEYTVTITQITRYTKKTFGVRSTVSLNTTDDLIYEDETLKFVDMERDKTYDIIIVYENATSGEELEFKVNDVKTSGDEQSIAVDDWKKLDEAEEKPVTFTEGKTEVRVGEGTTGEEIEELIEKEEKKDEEFPWLAIGIVAILVIFLAGAAIYLGNLPILMGKKKGFIILSCEVIPESPTVGETAELTAILRNDGTAIAANEHEVLVTFFDEFDSIDELDLSDTDFATSEEIKLPVVTWKPEKSGERSITAVLEIDGTEVEEHSFTVVVDDEKEELTDDSKNLDGRKKLEEALEENDDDE